MKSHRAASAFAACLVALAASTAAFAEQTETGIAADVLAKLERSFALDAQNRALMNAVTANDAKSLALNRELVMKQDEIFNFKIDAKGITDQKSSGRCWLCSSTWTQRQSRFRRDPTRPRP